MNKNYEYYYEKQPSGRYYVFYIDFRSMVKTLFDITDSKPKAETAIKQHKAGTHSTQQQETPK